jgi:hypothetical protein
MWLVGLLACGGRETKATVDGGPPDAPRDSAVPDASPSQITVILDGRPTDPARTKFVVAFQDGNKPWVAAPPPNGDQYKFTVDSDAWAVAWTCGFEAGSGYHIVMVARFTVAERTQFETPIPPYCNDTPAPPPTATLGGNATSFVGITMIQFETATTGSSGGKLPFHRATRDRGPRGHPPNHSRRQLQQDRGRRARRAWSRLERPDDR